MRAFGFGELKKENKKQNKQNNASHTKKTRKHPFWHLGACYLETDKPTFPNFILCKGSLC
jgi:hypothetical protein